MKEVIVFLVLALISYTFRILSINLSKDEFIDAREAKGIIIKSFDSDGGNISYYISFVTDDGEKLQGESIYYSSTKGKYRTNDLVPIKYVIGRKWDAMIQILDDELVPCEESMKTAARNMLIATVIFLLISAMFFVKNILL